MDLSEKVRENPGDDKEGAGALASSLRLGFICAYALMALMALAVLAKSVLTVKQHEIAVVSRFGAVSRILGNGLHFILPYPFEEAKLLDATRAKRIESLSFAVPVQKQGQLPPQTLRDAYLLSSDMNIIHAKASLAYSISPENHRAVLNFFFANQDGEGLLRSLFDNAILKASASSSSDELLFNPEALRSKVSSELRKNLAVNEIEILFESRDISFSGSAPTQTKTAFDSLSQARQNSETLLNDAESHRIRSEREALSSKDLIVGTAAAERDRAISSAKANAQNFAQRLEQYRKSPGIIAKTIYEDSISRIIGKVSEKFVVDPSEKREIRVLLGRNLQPDSSAKKESANGR